MPTYRVTWTSRDPRKQPICFRDFRHFAAASWYAAKVEENGLSAIIMVQEPDGFFIPAPEDQDGYTPPVNWSPTGFSA